MTASKTIAASISIKANTTGAMFEALESRQLMSANPAHSALPEHGHVAPALHASAKVNEGNFVGIGIIKYPVYFPWPTYFVEPKVNSDVKSWINVSKDPLFAKGGPSPADVIQNQVGDCWFLASLAEVAKTDPTLIEKTVSQRSDGTYDVRFHTSPTTTVDEHVDGQLPVNSWGGLEYAQLGQSNCTWVAVMEKALTYFRNRSIAADYATIGGGSGYESFSDLGGTPGELLGKVSNGSQLFTDVVWGLIFNTSIDIGTNGNAGPLVDGHEYSVISAREQNGVDQIEVRNPWGYNPNFTANTNGYGATNNGYMWVSVNSIYSQLDEAVSCGL